MKNRRKCPERNMKKSKDASIKYRIRNIKDTIKTPNTINWTPRKE